MLHGPLLARLVFSNEKACTCLDSLLRTVIEGNIMAEGKNKRKTKTYNAGLDDGRQL